MLFIGVALAHLLRLIYSWEVTVAGRPVPEWGSFIGAPGPAAIAWLLAEDI